MKAVVVVVMLVECGEGVLQAVVVVVVRCVLEVTISGVRNVTR